MASRYRITINIAVLVVIIVFACSVYFLTRMHDAQTAKKNETIYLPKFSPEYLKEIAREGYTLVEIEPNDPRISKKWIQEQINKQALESQPE